MSSCSWDMRPGGKGVEGQWIAKVPGGSCKVTKKGPNEIEYSCKASNGQADSEFDFSSVPQAKNAACSWLNDPEISMSSEKLKERYKKQRRQDMSRNKGTIFKNVLLMGAALGGGILAYRILKK